VKRGAEVAARVFEAQCEESCSDKYEERGLGGG